MKKITFIIAMFLTALGYSQSLPIEFNDAEAFEGQGGVAYSEDVSPTDSSNKVGKIDGGGDEWSSLIGLQLDTHINMTTPEKIFTFEFYTTEAAPMNGLLQLNSEEDDGYPIEMEFTTDGNIGWETITLDFNNARNGYPDSDKPVVYGNYAEINVFSNFGDTGSSTYYIDDISGAVNGAAVGSNPDPGTDPEEGAPEVAAQAPTWEDDVISVYSDAYTSIATNLNPGWGQSTQFSEVQIDGNNTMEYANLNYQGLDYPTTDVSDKGYVHLDYYTTDATAFQFFLISEDPTVENAYDIAAEDGITTGQWVSVNIPLSVYTANLDRVFQFKTVGNGTVYLDNIIFSSDVLSVGGVQKEALQVAPNPTSGLINKSGDVYNVSGQKVLTNSNDLSGLPSGIYFVKVISNGNVSTTKIIKE